MQTLLAQLSFDPAVITGGDATLAAVATFGVTVALFAVAILVARRMRRGPEHMARRLRDIAPESSGDQPDGAGLFGSLTPALAAQIPESQKERTDFQRLLRSAGLYSPHAATTIYALRFVLLFVPMTVAGVAAVMADSSRTITILVGGGIVAAVLSIIPRLYVFFRRRRRMRRIRQALPDTLDMLSMCIDGGLSLSQSLDHVAGQLREYPELAGELIILKRQAEVSSLGHALEDFAARVDMPEVRQLVGILGRSERLGTQLAGSLFGQADHLRVARKQTATLRANKTPVKLVLPVIFCFAPAAIILLTAPAMLELKEFLAPSQGQSVLGAGDGTLGTSSIIETLDELDQNVSTAR